MYIRGWLYATICGLTEEEIRTYFHKGVERLGGTLGISTEETYKKIKENYDGYHFSWPSPDVYNPFSIINALSRQNLDSYWFESGTPTHLLEMMRKKRLMPAELNRPMRALKESFDVAPERTRDMKPLLYQSGYLTLKSYNAVNGLYTLGIPNREIRIGLYKNLLP